MGIKDIWACPYNPAHVMENNHRIQTHLAKCRKNYPNQKNKRCYFNATHIVPERELDSHMMNCPDNKAFLRERVHVPNEFVPPPTTEPIDETAYSEHAGGEVWGVSDTGKPGYDPSLEMKHKPIMCKPMPCAGKATQREFRKKDVERLERLAQGLPPDDEPEMPRPPVYERMVPKAPVTMSKLQMAQRARKEQSVAALEDSPKVGNMRPFHYQNRATGIVGEFEDDYQGACSSAPYMPPGDAAAAQFAGAELPPRSQGRGISFNNNTPFSSTGSDFMPRIPFGRGRGMGMDLSRPGSNPTGMDIGSRGIGRGSVITSPAWGEDFQKPMMNDFHVAGRDFQKPRDYFQIPNNDLQMPREDFHIQNNLSGAQDRNIHEIEKEYIEQLDEIKAIKERQRRGLFQLADEEVKLLVAETKIKEALEKLNIGS